MISNVTAPCSACGQRTRTATCARCDARAIAFAGRVEDRLLFEQEEVERLTRGDVARPHLDAFTVSPLDVAIVSSGIPRNIALVSCGKAKLRTLTKVPAHQLYVGTPFKLAYRYALATADDVQIVSALHGLLGPYELVMPYEFRLTQLLPSERAMWGTRIVKTLKSLYPLAHLRIIFYASRAYIRPILAAITDEDRQYWELVDPLQGLDMFERNHWLKQKLEDLDGVPF